MTRARDISKIVTDADLSGTLDVTGAVTVGDGAVGTPAISFASDTNTGIYRGGTDILKFVTAGTDAITISANQSTTLAGNLNVSKVNANTVLDGTTGYSLLKIKGDSTLRIDFGTSADDDAGRIQYDTSSNEMRFFTNGTKRMDIDSGGDISFYEDTGTTAKLFWDASAEKLGVGSSSPVYALHVQRTSEADIFLRRTDLTNKAWLFNLATDGNLNFKYRNDDGSADGTSLVLDRSGNVGIGASSPGKTLEVAASGGTPGIRLRRTDITNSDVDLTTGGGATGKDFSISVNQSERLRINSAGSVSIGTSSSPNNAPLLIKCATDDNIRISQQTHASIQAVNDAANAYTELKLDGSTLLLNTQSSGNVGIGESNPVAKTHIQGSGTSGQVTASLILENSSSGTAGMDITGSAGSSRLRFLYGGGPNTGTNTLTEAMNIVLEGSNAGNVGIGNSASGFNAGANNLVVGTGSGSEGITIYADNSSNSAIFFADPDSVTTGQINYQHASNAFTFHTNGGTERMRIDSSGNIHIGGTAENASSSFSFMNSGGDSYLNFNMNGRTSPITNTNGCYIWSGEGSTGDYLAGTLVLQSRSNQSRNIAFITGTSPTERMRINGAGTIQISGPSGAGSIATDGLQFIPASNKVEQRIYVGTTVSRTVVSFRNSNGQVGYIAVAGTSTSYNTSSDHRLKENVTADWDATTRLKQLNPVRFNFIADADTTVDGFLAHEVQSVVPEAITGTHNEVDDDGNPVYQGIDQSKLVPLLVKTIQELEARIVALETA